MATTSSFGTRRQPLRSAALLGWSAALIFATTADAAAPRTSRRPAPRPVAQPAAPRTAAPASGSTPAKTASPSNGPTPTPPQPRREGEPSLKPSSSPAPAATTAKPAADEPATKPADEPSEKPSGDGSATTSPTTPAPVQSRTSNLFGAPPIDIKPNAEGKYLLRYHFSTGETVRWDVTHRAKFISTVQGNTETAETTTMSRKVWKVVDTTPAGDATLVHMVESIDMRQKLTGRQETRYNSRTDEEVPPIFAEAAKQVGVPLTKVTIDNRGNVISRIDQIQRPEGTPTSTITVVLPDRPLAIGESWTVPFNLTVTVDGTPQVLKARHKMTLESVTQTLAVLKNETQILSPVRDPAVESQIVQAEPSGKLTFDLRLGRIVEQNSAVDREVFGFQGPESKLHYQSEFGETLVDGAATAADVRSATEDDKTAATPATTTTK